MPDSYRSPRLVMRVVRLLIALAFIVYMLSAIFSIKTGFLIGIAAVIFILLLTSSRLRARMNHIEDTFLNNLNERELRRSGKNNSIVSDMHLAYMKVGYDCQFVGRKLRDTELRSRYGVSVSSISRGANVVMVPSGDARVFPGDILGIIGTDEQIGALLPIVEAGSAEVNEASAPSDHRLTSVALSDNSPLLGQTIVSANIGHKYSILVIAVERQGEFVDLGVLTFAPGDIIHLVGRPADICALA